MICRNIRTPVITVVWSLLHSVRFVRWTNKDAFISTFLRKCAAPDENHTILFWYRWNSTTCAHTPIHSAANVICYLIEVCSLSRFLVEYLVLKRLRVAACLCYQEPYRYSYSNSIWIQNCATVCCVIWQLFEHYIELNPSAHNKKKSRQPRGCDLHFFQHTHSQRRLCTFDCYTHKCWERFERAKRWTPLWTQTTGIAWTVIIWLVYVRYVIILELHGICADKTKTVEKHIEHISLLLADVAFAILLNVGRVCVCVYGLVHPLLHWQWSASVDFITMKMQIVNANDGT